MRICKMCDQPTQLGGPHDMTEEDARRGGRAPCARCGTEASPTCTWVGHFFYRCHCGNRWADLGAGLQTTL